MSTGLASLATSLASVRRPIELGRVLVDHVVNRGATRVVVAMRLVDDGGRSTVAALGVDSGQTALWNVQHVSRDEVLGAAPWDAAELSGSLLVGDDSSDEPRLAVFSDVAGALDSLTSWHELLLAHAERVVDLHLLQRAARTLSAGLQPAPLPDGHLGGLELRAGLRAGSEALDVGGDWWSAIARPNGQVVLAVGDVTGHGAAAAVVMAQMRITFEALASEKPTDVVLARLNGLLRGGPLGATAVVVDVDPDGGVEWWTAGHPAPVVFGPGGNRLLSGATGPMLGLQDEPVFDASAEGLRAGEVLALFTDGLVEAGSEPTEVGLARLLRVVDGPVEDLARIEQALMERARSDDDTLVLLARRALADQTEA